MSPAAVKGQAFLEACLFTDPCPLFLLSADSEIRSDALPDTSWQQR